MYDQVTDLQERKTKDKEEQEKRGKKEQQTSIHTYNNINIIYVYVIPPYEVYSAYILYTLSRGGIIDLYHDEDSI